MLNAWSSAEDVARPPPSPPKYIYLELVRSTLYTFVGHPVNQILSHNYSQTMVGNIIEILFRGGYLEARS